MQRQNVIAKWAMLCTPRTLLICFPSGLGRARVFVSEFEMAAYEVANGLHAAPSKRAASEQSPSDLRQMVGLADPELPSKNTRVSSGNFCTVC